MNAHLPLEVVYELRNGLLVTDVPEFAFFSESIEFLSTSDIVSP